MSSIYANDKKHPAKTSRSGDKLRFVRDHDEDWFMLLKDESSSWANE